MALINISNRIKCINLLTNQAKHFVFSQPLTTSSILRNEESKFTLQKFDRRTKEVKITAAIKGYLKTAKEYENVLAKERQEYDVGRRHLAYMMGEDPDTFTQDKIDDAIKYLFPSGLFSPGARPKLKPPEEFFPKKKKLQCSLDGRPLHSLYYTAKPNYYQIMHEAVYILEYLKKAEDDQLMKQISNPNDKTAPVIKPIILSSSEWITLQELEDQTVETISDEMYARFKALLERITAHPHVSRAEQFIMRFRKPLQMVQEKLELPKPQVDPVTGLKYAEAYGQRKWAIAEVRLYMHGTGEITINGQGILAVFPNLSDREQIIFPLIFTGFLGNVNIDATVSGGGSTGQSGALRLAISRGLACFLGPDEIKRMRLAGILTQDMRFKERKKPGQVKARKKYTWKAR